MSGVDKTGEKLVASIRKTKAGAAKPEQAAPAKTAKTTGVPSKTARAQSSKPATKSRRTRTTRRNIDPYTSGRRVWPD